MRRYPRTKWDKPPRKGPYKPLRGGKQYQYFPPVKQRVDLQGARKPSYQIQQHVFKDRLHTASLIKRIAYMERLEQRGEPASISLTGMSDRDMMRLLTRQTRKIDPVV